MDLEIYNPGNEQGGHCCKTSSLFHETNEGPQNTIDIYCGKVYFQKCSKEDKIFSIYLGHLVNQEDGFVGWHLGWVIGGALHQAKLYESEDGDAEQLTHPHARASRSVALKSLLTDPRGKGKATKRVLDDLSKPPSSQGGDDGDEEQLPPPLARSTALKSLLADPEGKQKLTLRPGSRAHTPIRTSRRCMEDSSNKELALSSSTRTKQKKPLGCMKRTWTATMKKMMGIP